MSGDKENHIISSPSAALTSVTFLQHVLNNRPTNTGEDSDRRGKEEEGQSGYMSNMRSTKLLFRFWKLFVMDIIRKSRGIVK